MFNKHTDTRVDTLICGELRTAKEQHGEKFNSLHEAYAVALEELEEAIENVDMCKCWYKEIWDYIKWDEKESRLVEPLKEVRKYTVEAIKELAQLAAMVDKTLESMKIEDAKRENKDIGDAEVL